MVTHRAETKPYTYLMFTKPHCFQALVGHKHLKLAFVFSDKKQRSQPIYPQHILSIKQQWTFPPMTSSIGVFQWFSYSMCDPQVPSVAILPAQYSAKQSYFLRAGLT